MFSPQGDMAMTDEIVQASEAFRQGADRMQGLLRMAMKTCPHCKAMHVIASPEMGTCADCGVALEEVRFV